MREAKKLFDATRKVAESLKNVSLIVAPPSIFLRELSSTYKGKRIALAGQNGNAESVGAFTGDTSIVQLKNAKASYLIVGHSERRAAGETNDDTRKKIAVALAQKLTPVVCVGEKEREENGSHFAFIREELRAAFADVAPNAVHKVIVGYEPIWAIGGEKSMNPREMHEMAIFIRKTLVETHGEAALKVKILYGGSVNEQNARPMLEGGDVLGFVIGHVSVDAPRFEKLLRSLV